MKAVFLDRDGVLIDNSRHYYIFRVEDVSFVEGIFENLILLQDRGFHFFVVTNQGGIAKKEYTKKDVERLHAHLANEFQRQGITITDWVYCPHHDTVEKCLCRKPSPLMIEKMISKYAIDKRSSFLIGDSKRDIIAAEKAGVEGILIPSNQNMRPYIKQIL